MLLPDLQFEFTFKTSRASGAGGQNVNKVSTKVELIFHVENSAILSDAEKTLLRERLSHRIRRDGAIHLTSQEARTQGGNKEAVIERFYALLEEALKPVKKRKKKKLSAGEKEKRMEEKKNRAQKKELRHKPRIELFVLALFFPCETGMDIFPPHNHIHPPGSSCIVRHHYPNIILLRMNHNKKLKDNQISR